MLVSAMRGTGVLQTAYRHDQIKRPRLTFIVVGKRHHMRFFADKGGQDPRGNDNLASGFVVDQGIVHPSIKTSISSRNLISKEVRDIRHAKDWVTANYSL
ncbi:hypothetical protein H0H87_002718 [Tephrocybe sp. NHM501043]|nr:hypothetical protein H0H87_002718 [Tephrocybe sp. NHM501043]